MARFSAPGLTHWDIYYVGGQCCEEGAIMTVKSLLMYCLTLCISSVSVMFWQCIVYVSGMYHGCIMIVISMYLSCIMDVLEVAPHTSVFLHTLPITFDMAAPDMLFGRQGIHVPACPLGCCSAETTAGQASTRGPYTPCSRPEPLGCCGGANRAQKTVKSTS